MTRTDTLSTGSRGGSDMTGKTTETERDNAHPLDAYSTRSIMTLAAVLFVALCIIVMLP